MGMGERIKTERERMGMTIPRFAEVAGAAKNTVIDWQNGKSTPPAAKLAALASAGVDVLYILTGQRTAGAPAPEPLSREQLALLDNYTHCAPADQDALRRLAATAAQPGVATRKTSGKRSA